jgi:hypothetical protein
MANDRAAGRGCGAEPRCRALTRSPNNLSWAAMNDEQAPARTDTPGELASGPTLARVRRRGESHLLALMSAAAVVFVAIAIAKPWGASAPPPGASAATPSLVAQTSQSVANVVEPGEVPITSALVCTEDIGSVGTVDPTFGVYTWPVGDGTSTTTFAPSATTLSGSFATPGVGPWVIVGAEPVTGSQDMTGVLVCTEANLQGLEVVLPSPSAP